MALSVINLSARRAVIHKANWSNGCAHDKRWLSQAKGGDAKTYRPGGGHWRTWPGEAPGYAVLPPQSCPHTIRARACGGRIWRQLLLGGN